MSVVLHPYCGGGSSDGFRKGTDLDKDIALDSLRFQVYNEEMLWTLKKYLFEKLKLDDSLLYNDSAFISFYDSMLNTPVNGFTNVKKNLKEIFNMDSLVKVILNEKKHLIKVNMAVIESYQTQLNDPLLTDQARQSINNNIKSLQMTNKLIQEYITTLLSQQKSGKLVIANTAEAINNGIGTTRTIESNLKTVNEIYLSSYARGNRNLSSSQINAIYNIAQQCPAAGGEGVFKARSMYYMINKNIMYDDKQTCLNQGILYRQRNVSDFPCQLFPNPTAGEVTFTYNLPEEINGYLTIIDNFGRIIIKKQLKPDTNTFHFNTENYPDGIYYIKMIGEDGTHYEGKLTVIH